MGLTSSEDDYLQRGGVDPAFLPGATQQQQLGRAAAAQSLLLGGGAAPTYGHGAGEPSLHGAPSPAAAVGKPLLFSSPAASPRYTEELYLNGYGRAFGEKITYSAGLSYATGLTLGAAYGMCVGLRRGGSTPRLRLNAVLNACGEHAPKTGAQLGTLTFFYCCFKNLLSLFREDAQSNAPIAGAAAGCLYKALGSWRLRAVYSATSSSRRRGDEETQTGERKSQKEHERVPEAAGPLERNTRCRECRKRRRRRAFF